MSKTNEELEQDYKDATADHDTACNIASATCEIRIATYNLWQNALKEKK